MQSKANKLRRRDNQRKRLIKHLRNMIAKGAASRPHITKTVNAYFPLAGSPLLWPGVNRNQAARALWLLQASAAGVIDEKDVPQPPKYIPPPEEMRVVAWGEEDQDKDWKALGDVADAYGIR